MVRRTYIPPSSIAALATVVGVAIIAFSIFKVGEPSNHEKASQTPENTLVTRSVETQTSENSPQTIRVRDEVVSIREDFRRTLTAESATVSEASDPSSAATGVAHSAAEPHPVQPTLPAEISTDAMPADQPDPVATFIDQPRLWLPAAMLEPDESIGISSELQVAEWEQLQEDFVRAVNGTMPGNKADREVWIRAQQENDDLFRAKFGWDAFNAQQLKAYREGLAPQSP